MNNITIKTDYPIAFDSPDHITPWGTMRDNTSNLDFIEEIQTFFKEDKEKDNFNFLDLGCSGGQLVIDFHKRGNLSVGLEGSDYSVKHQRANWPDYHNINLFTCDVTKPYSVYNNGEIVKFDMINAWEVVEHIHPEDLSNFFMHINNNLKPGGIFLASISVVPDNATGIDLHQSVFSEGEWYNKFPQILENTNLKLCIYPFTYKVRNENTSFHIMLIKE
jgi:cyclopropane fatty-acyl-phospholipid synthase-like methyltransferase